MTNLFVLGVSGYIGRNLYPYLLEKFPEKQVRGAGRKSTHIRVDLDQYEDELTSVVVPGDTVVFLAGMSSPSECQSNPEKARRVNLENTAELIGMLVKKEVRVIFASSDLVFGRAKSAVTEDSLPAPFGVYGEMKAEIELLFANSKFVKFARLPNVIGMDDTFTTVMKKASSYHQILEVYEGYHRNTVCLGDILEGVENLIRNWGSYNFNKINFSGPSLISKVEIAEIYKEVLIPNFQFESVKPPEDFWKARPKIIQMESVHFHEVLGRAPSSLKAWFLERNL